LSSKVIKKKALKGDLSAVFDEVHVLEGLDHPNIGRFSARYGTVGWRC
jgi:hypothetical protein